MIENKERERRKEERRRKDEKWKINTSSIWLLPMNIPRPSTVFS